MNDKKKIGFFLSIAVAAFLCLMLFPYRALASDATNDGKTVRVAVINYPNYLTKNDAGMISGYAYEYLQEIATYTGWQYEYEEMTFSQAMDALKKGEIDILPGNQYTEARAETMDFSSQSMGDGGSVLCVRTDDLQYSYNDYGAYNGMKIAALAGSVRMEQAKAKLAEYGATADFVEYDTDDAAKAALENKEVDAVLMSSIRCEDQYKILARLDSIPLYFCSNKNRPELKNELDKAMESIHLDNPYYDQQLNEKYYGSISVQLAYTREEKEYIAAAKTITVAMSGDFAPIEYYDKQGHCFRGLVPDMMNLIAENSGLKFRYVLRNSMDDTLKKVSTGEIMMIASVANNTEIADAWNVSLTDAYRTNSLSIVMNNANKEYQNLDCQVVLKQGYPYLEQAAVKQGYNNFIYADTFADCVKMVHNNKAAMSFIPSNSIDLILGQLGYDDMSTYLLLNSNIDFSIGVSKTVNPLLISILNKSIASISTEEKNALLSENLTTANDNISVRKFFMIHRIGILSVVIGLAIIIISITCMLAIARKRANRRLEKALKQADSANDAKTDFLSRMSHDIRTPMNVIIGLTDLAGDEEMSDTAHEYLEKIGSSSQFLLGLINDILDMSKIESGELSLNPEPYGLEEFTQNVSTMLAPLMEAKHIEFEFDTSKAYQCILIDRLRHNQIFFNLLSNACKFTPEGGKVEFSITPLGTKDGLVGQRYCVRDNGIGMSEAFTKHLFEPFTQEHTVDNEKETGTGLGLSIVKSLVDAMGGTIAVKSELGKGTEFDICLYYPLAEANMEVTKPAANYDILQNAEILLAEDHPLNAEIAVKLLERAGCQVTWAKDGKECVELFDASEPHHYDLILMDMRMPVMDGLAATRKIRSLAREDAGSIPILAMTANAYEEDVERCKEAGMNAHIAKPVEPQMMYETMVLAMRKSSKL